MSYDAMHGCCASCGATMEMKGLNMTGEKCLECGGIYRRLGPPDRIRDRVDVKIGLVRQQLEELGKLAMSAVPPWWPEFKRLEAIVAELFQYASSETLAVEDFVDLAMPKIEEAKVAADALREAIEKEHGGSP